MTIYDIISKSNNSITFKIMKDGYTLDTLKFSDLGNKIYGDDEVVEIYKDDEGYICLEIA